MDNLNPSYFIRNVSEMNRSLWRGRCKHRKPAMPRDFQITEGAVKKGVAQTYIACGKKLTLRDIAIEWAEFKDQKLSVRQGQAEVQGTVHQNP